MGDIPLHPAVVHVPLGLAVLMPVLALVFTAAWWKGWAGKRGWALVVGLQLLLFGAGLFVKQTGERETRNARRVLVRGTIHPHSQAADYFVWASGATMVIAGLGLGLRDRRARWAAAATTVATVVVAGIAVRVGHLGGELVYVKGAATVYTADSTAALQRAAAAQPPAPDTARGAPTR
jgi:uncharacterized membrane protein